MSREQVDSHSIRSMPWEIADHVYVIAEIGINHNGDLDLALELISQAAQAGCDAVKFQKRVPELCVPESQKHQMRDTPWGRMSYLEYKERIEFGKREYDAIARRCQELNIDWSASAWDLPSQEFLRNYERPFNKIASAIITDTQLVRSIADDGIKTFMSTGMSTLEEIDRAVDVVVARQCPLELMHSVSTYPAEERDLNLLMIRTLRERYSVDVGYSGHEASVSPSVTAVLLGATSLERHFTLSRAMWGSDHAASLEPEGMRKLVGSVRKLKRTLGNGVKVVLPGEVEVAKRLRFSSENSE